MKKDKTRDGRPERLLWMDVETTGTDTLSDHLLEAEMRVTLMDASKVEHRVHVVFPRRWADDLSGWVGQTHRANGLLDECVAADRDRYPARDVLTQWFMFMHEDYRLHPAGSSVHFDMAFLSRLLGEDPERLTDHQWVDETSVVRTLEAAGVTVPEVGRTDHRTSTCLDLEIRRYRLILDMLHRLNGKEES